MKKLNSVLFEALLYLNENIDNSENVLYSDETMIIDKSSSIRIYHVIPANRNFGPIKIELNSDSTYLLAYAKKDISLVQIVSKSVLSELFQAELNVSVIDGVIHNYIAPIILEAYKLYKKTIK